MTFNISKLLRHYRTIFFWLVVSLGLVLGEAPVIGTMFLAGLAGLATLIRLTPTNSIQDVLDTGDSAV